MNYEQQAQNFLDKTGTSFECSFLKYGKHFDNDDQDRDIYKIVLTKNGRIYAFNFGQSINNSGIKYKYGLNIKTLNITDSMRKQLLQSKSPQTKVINFIKQNINWDFGKANDKIILPTKPTPYDVLSCLTTYEEGSVKDFCGEYGYNEDSCKAHKTYDAVRDEYINIERLFSKEEIDLLQEIQ